MKHRREEPCPTSSQRGGKRYRYYLCCGAHRRGRHNCPSGSIPAWAIEEVVLEQIQHQKPDLDVRGQTPGAQLYLVRLWIGRIDYDGAQNKVAIAFRPARSSVANAEGSHCTQESNP